MKRIIALTVAVALALSGCAGDQAYLKAQADALVAQSNARVAEAQAATEQAKAVQSLAGKIDAGGAAAYLISTQLKGTGGTTQVVQQVQRPRDWLDYVQGGSQAFAALASALTPWGLALEQGKTARAGFARDVQIEGARQTGESTRIQSVASIASDVAGRTVAPNITNTYTLSGTGVLGSGTYAGPVTTTRNCNGGTAGNGAAGGNGTTAGGSGAAGGPANGGTC